MDTLPSEVKGWISRVRELQSEVAELQEHIAAWRASVDDELIALGMETPAQSMMQRLLTGRAAGPPKGRKPKGRKSQREQVIEAVQRADRPVRTEDVQSILDGQDITMDRASIRSYLSVGAKAGDLERVGSGLYVARDAQQNATTPQ